MSDRLLVQQTWITNHAPNLCDVTVGPLVHSSDGRAATRTISAWVDGQKEVLSSSVNYGVPTISSERKLMADRNRRKEEAAILALDSGAAVEHRAKKARLQQGLREQRQNVDEGKVLRSMLERLVSQVERQADAKRRHEEQAQRLRLSGRAASLHIGDLAYIRHPNFPPPYLQLAVLRRVHRSGAKVDVQLCHLSPPEMGSKGVDRISLDSMLRGMDTSSVIAPVAPQTRERDRNNYVREFWPTVQLWTAAELAERQSNICAARLYSHLQTTEHCGCPNHTNPFAMHSHVVHCSFMTNRVPLLGELAEAALPTFLQWRHPLWKCCICSLDPDEIEHAAEREYAVRV